MLFPPGAIFDDGRTAALLPTHGPALELYDGETAGAFRDTLLFAMSSNGLLVLKGMYIIVTAPKS